MELWDVPMTTAVFLDYSSNNVCISHRNVLATAQGGAGGGWCWRASWQLCVCVCVFVHV